MNFKRNIQTDLSQNSIPIGNGSNSVYCLSKKINIVSLIMVQIYIETFVFRDFLIEKNRKKLFQVFLIKIFKFEILNRVFVKINLFDFFEDV